jgi:hypothetical protein
MREIIERGLKAGHLQRLLHRHHVYLFAPSGYGERFAWLFVETWRRLPYVARRRVLRHWKTDLGAVTQLSPQIDLLPDWSGRGDEPGLGGAKAAVGGLGRQTAFWTRIIDAYPDELVRDLIAHELAHVFQWATGWDIDQAGPCTCEQEAEVLVEAWGFSSTAMDDWDKAHGITTVPDLDGLDEAGRARLLEQQPALVMNYGR